MTVRETFDFSGRCQGVGTRYEMLEELSRREKEAGIKPDPEIDAFMKAISVSGQRTNLFTDYVLKVLPPSLLLNQRQSSFLFSFCLKLNLEHFLQILGLDICADIIVGNEMRRGISGGQRKRVTTGMFLLQVNHFAGFVGIGNETDFNLWLFLIFGRGDVGWTSKGTVYG